MGLRGPERTSGLEGEASRRLEGENEVEFVGSRGHVKDLSRWHPFLSSLARRSNLKAAARAVGWCYN